MLLKISDFCQSELETLLKQGLYLRSGSFNLCLRSDLSELASLLWRMYSDYPIGDREFADFHIRLFSYRKATRWFAPQIQFWMDAESPFEPFPRGHALPFLEWGINWCVATRAHQYLMLHAGVLERNGYALLLPAWPGSGKSTLCASLCHRGWRLLSDEFALVRPLDCQIVPFPRLISLKNNAISIVRNFIPECVLGPEYHNTRKGTVCHVRPPRDSIDRADQTAQVRWIVFPKYRKGAVMNLRSVDKTEAFVTLSGHSFNYDLIGLRGFQAMTGLIDACDCYAFEYGGDLEQAVAQLNALAEGLI